MKCFIHGDREARAICLICGKAMCIDCSAYTGHSGKCPSCYLGEFRKQKNGKLTLITFMVIFAIAATVASVILAVQQEQPLYYLLNLLSAMFLIIAIVQSKKVKFVNRQVEIIENAMRQGKPQIDYDDYNRR